MPRIVRPFAVGALVFALASSTLQALPLVPRAHEARSAAVDLATAAWEWVASVFSTHRAPAGSPAGNVQEQEGSQLDPNGHH
jgi:hypothetical protein